MGILCLCASLPSLASALQAPIFMDQSAGPLLRIKGTSLQLMVVATGDPAPTFQWQLNNKAIPNAVLPTYAVDSTALKDGGGYTCVAKNSKGSITSTPVQVVVVDPAVQELPLYVGKPAKLAAAIAGADVPVVWRKDGQSLTASLRVKDIDKVTLNITQGSEEDFGLYSCEITTPAGSATAEMMVVPVSQVPVIVEPDWLRQDAPPAAGQIGYAFSDDIEAEHYPSKFIITGLPPGLKADPVTGEITGRFTKAGTYQVKLSAVSPLGTGPILTLPMVVAPLPAGSQGSFVGLTPSHESNQGLGGLTNVTVTPTCSYTVKMQMGTLSLSFGGQLAADGPETAMTGLSRSGSGNSTMWLRLTLPSPPQDQVLLSLSQGQTAEAVPLFIMGATHCLTRDLVGFAGYHTLQLSGGPSGTSFGTATASAKAVATATLRMVDGSTITVGGSLVSGADLLCHKLLYGNKGWMIGYIRLQPMDVLANGHMDWFKPQPLRPGRLLPEEIRASVDLYASIWPSSQKTLHAALKEGVVALESAFEDTFVLKSGSGSGFHPASEEYPARLTAFSLNVSTGVFTGSVKLAYPVGSVGDPPRFLYHTAAIQGVVTPGDSSYEVSGAGYYHMPEPPDLLANPPTSLSTSRIVPLSISFTGSLYPGPASAP